MEILYSLFCFFVPNCVWLFFKRKKLMFQASDLRRHLIWSFVFMFYIYLAVQIVAGIGTIWDLVAYGKLDDNINLIPFSSDGLRTYLLNVIMFLPLGFLLPLIWKRFRRVSITLLSGFGLSLVIELGQLLTLRETDVDDLIMNTLGTFIGYIIWVLFKKVFKQAGERSIEIGKYEPIVYLVLGILGIMLLFNWRLLY